MTLEEVKNSQGWDAQEKAQCEQIPHESDKEWNNQLLSAVGLQKWRYSSEMRFRREASPTEPVLPAVSSS